MWQVEGQTSYTLKTSTSGVLTLLMANTHSVQQDDVFMRDLAHHASCLKESLRGDRERHTFNHLKSNHTDERILGVEIMWKIQFKSAHGSLQLKMTTIRFPFIH